MFIYTYNGAEETFKDRRTAEIHLQREKATIPSLKATLAKAEGFIAALETALKNTPHTKEELFEMLHDICLDAISYVGDANTAERERDAKTVIRSSFAAVEADRTPEIFNVQLRQVSLAAKEARMKGNFK